MLPCATSTVKWIVALCIVFLGIVSVTLVALGVSGVFTRTSHTTTTQSPQSHFSASSLNNVSLYPSGSYSAYLSAFTQASSALALTPLDQTILNQVGFIDHSSSIFEAGRLQYLYFHVPAGSRSSTITGIGLYFGTAGNNDALVVIPIRSTSSSSSQQIPGVTIPVTMPDSSIILRIEMTVASSLCSSIGTSPVNICAATAYEARAVVNSNQITSIISIGVNVACGDICSLPSSLCSTTCATCTGQQVAGADTPVSRRYNMGATSATFQFEYETYSIMDRITVWNGATRLFDTGCVGARATVSITYTDASPSIRVDVEPNCACTTVSGCSGTAWYFQVHCLNGTNG